MAKVRYATGIDTVSGSLSKPKVKNGHKCGSYLIGTHRTAATTNPNCTRLYVKTADAYDRSTPVTQNEQGARMRFSAVSAAVNARAKNLSTISQDQRNWLAQKDEPDGIKTFKAWLWKQEGDAYDAQHNG